MEQEQAHYKINIFLKKMVCFYNYFVVLKPVLFRDIKQLAISSLNAQV